MILRLEDVLNDQYQNPGVRQNAYKYKIVPLLECLDKDNRNIYHIYSDIKDIPEVYMKQEVYNIEPDIDPDTHCMYLKIKIRY